MEEATISQLENEKVQSTGMPMLVTEDDLQLEIGRWVVSGLNKDKIIKRMVEIQQEQIVTIAKMQVTIDKSGPLEILNSKLGAKNKDLGDAVTVARTEAKERVAEAKEEANAKVAEAKEEANAKVAEAKEDMRARLAEVKADDSKKTAKAKEGAEIRIATAKEEALVKLIESEKEVEKKDKIIDGLKVKLAKLKPASKRKK